MSTHADAVGRLGKGAEFYARDLGWKVFPCWGIIGGKCECPQKNHEKGPKDWGKHPNGTLNHNGHKSASNDPAQVHEWWTRFPENNVGVACRDSGFLVVDVDPRNDEHESWDALESQVGGMPRTVEAATGAYQVPSGGVKRGRHLFYQVQPGEALHNKVGGLKGIDIQHAGYVMLNPSRHGSGFCYDWLPGQAPWAGKPGGMEMASAPDELLALIRKRPRSTNPGSAGMEYGVFDWGGEKLDFDAILERGIYDGERHTLMFRMMCAMSNKYPVDTEHGRASVMRNWSIINATRVHPPLLEDDLHTQVTNAMDFVRDNPLSKMVTSAIGPAMDWVVEQSAKSAGITINEKPRAAMRQAAGGAAVGVAGAMPADPLEELPPDMDEWGDDEEDGVKRRTLTDRGNARRLRDYYQGRCRYTEGMGWFLWNGAYWEPDGEGLGVLERTQTLAAIVSREMAGLTPGDEDWKRVAAWVTQCKSTAKMKAAIDQWKADSGVTRVSVESWDANPQYLGVMNGVIDLKTGRLMPGALDMGITKRTEVAYTERSTNVRWTEFLDFATGGDKELQSWLQKAAGYTLTGMRHHDVLFMVHGQPGSGKSTFLEALGHALGKGYMTAMNSSVLVDDGMKSSSDEYHWASLRGKRMVIFSEWPHGKKTKEDAVKRLTGDMTIQARNPTEKPFNFESQAKLWIGTNSLPYIQEDAMWRRIRAIPFPYVPTAPDPELKPFLIDPHGGLPAVLAWAVEGAVRLLNSGDRDSLGWCKAVKDSSEKYRAQEDRMGIFLEEETEVSPGASVPVKVLHDVHRAWSEDRGEHGMTATPFKKALEERGLSVDGIGRRAILHDRRLLPRVAEAPAGVPDWSDLTRFAR